MKQHCYCIHTPPLIWLAALVLLFNSYAGSAQIVNIEKERIRNHDSVGVMGKVAATIDITQNVNMLVSAAFNPHLQYKNRRHLVLAIAQTEYAAVDNKTISSGGFFHLRHNYTLHKNIKSDCFTQIQFNNVWNMPLRFLIGAGPRMKVLDIKKNKFYFGPLYMYEIQHVKTDNYTQYNHRLSAYISWNIEPNDIIFFSGTVYYQPLLKDFRNYRLTSLCELNFVISRRFTFDNHFKIIFDQTGTTDIPPETYQYTAGLGYTF